MKQSVCKECPEYLALTEQCLYHHCDVKEVNDCGHVKECDPVMDFEERVRYDKPVQCSFKQKSVIEW